MFQLKQIVKNVIFPQSVAHKLTQLTDMLASIPRYVKVLVIFTIANLIILVIRNSIVGTEFFNFLKSNMFSAFLPFIIAMVIQFFHRKMNAFWFVMASLVWLLFYPNAPYMISDLIHPHQETMDNVHPTLIVYDTLIVFSIAMLAVFYGFISLKIIFTLYKHKFGVKKAHAFIVFSLILSCLGFYIGRELKSGTDFGNGYLYSWQAFTEPVYVLKAVYNSLFPIVEKQSAWWMMLLFGFVQYQLLMIMKDVGDIEAGRAITKDELPVN